MTNVSDTSSAFPNLGEISTGLLVLEIGVLLIMTILGALGNVCFCVMVYKSRQLQTVSNYLIVNLAITDLLRIFTTTSVSVIVIAKRTWIFGELFCRVNGCYTLVLLVASLMSVTLISINRYFVIVHPNHSKSVFTKKRMSSMLVALWLLAAISGMPPNLGWGEYGFFAPRATCFIAVGSSYSYTSVLVVAFIGFPFSVIIFCYMKVYLAVRRSKRRVVDNGLKGLTAPVASNASITENVGKEVKVAQTVFLLVAVYIVTWIPIMVLHFLRMTGINKIPDLVDLAAAFLVSASCVTNPWIYGLRTSQFRDQLRGMFCMNIPQRCNEQREANGAMTGVN